MDLKGQHLEAEPAIDAEDYDSHEVTDEWSGGAKDGTIGGGTGELP